MAPDVCRQCKNSRAAAIFLSVVLFARLPGGKIYAILVADGNAKQIRE